MTLRRTFLAALTVCGVLLAVRPGWATAETDPKAFVARLAAQAMEIMTAKGLSSDVRANRFRSLFTGEVDLPEIGKFVLGRYWRIATPEQQNEFVRLFEDIVVLTWSGRFKDYGGDLRHTVTDTAQEPDRSLLVSSRVERQGQPPINLQWRLKPSDAGFKVVDLIVEGASMAITYRSEYSSVIQREDGKLEGLLSAMRNKISTLKDLAKG